MHSCNLFNIPNHWSPRQALAVYDFLSELQQQIWDRYEHTLVELIIADLEYEHPIKSDLHDFEDEIPF